MMGYFRFQISDFRFLVLIAGFCLVSTSIFAQNDDDVIKVDSSLVVLNATITDSNGKPAANLKQNLFKIFEDGIEQEISFFETQDSPFAAVVLLDTSGSMENRISLARASAINFLGGLRGEDNVAIYSFDSKVTLIQDFSTSRDVADKIFDVKAYGWTVLNDAVYKAAEELAKRPEKRKAIVVLSDGMDTKSGRSADKALKLALSTNATIYTVDMSTLGDKDRPQSVMVLKNFAEKSGGKFIATDDVKSLTSAFKSIAGEIGTQYTLGYSPKNTTKDGKWRAIELRVAKPNLTIRTRKGYNASKESKK
jgi:Ca-activated chloride channel homolog